MNFRIGGIQKSSLLDYPDKISAIVFTQGCNFRCGYCHNPELIAISTPKVSTEECFAFLQTRIGKLDGVVITGGEPCIQSGLKDFIKKIKSLGFLVKLDTNGAYPEILRELLDETLLDYIAIDIKAPLDKYTEITKNIANTEKIKESIRLIMNSDAEYEFRTTIIKSQLSFEDFEKIGKLIHGAKKYYLQKFEPSKIVDKTLINEKTYSTEDFDRIIQILQASIKWVEVR